MTTKAERDEIIHERWRARMENDFAPPIRQSKRRTRAYAWR
jgi:hypothetical protein